MNYYKLDMDRMGLSANEITLTAVDPRNPRLRTAQTIKHGAYFASPVEFKKAGYISVTKAEFDKATKALEKLAAAQAEAPTPAPRKISPDKE